MMKLGERRPYWRQTKSLALFCLVILLGTTFTLPFFVGDLNKGRFLEFPLGYYLIGHGMILLLIGVTAFFMARQDSIDRLHGAHEDI